MGIIRMLDRIQAFQIDGIAEDEQTILREVFPKQNPNGLFTRLLPQV